MSLLPPTLLQSLGRSRLSVRRAVASGGVGERRSRAKGAGIEFADHRPYQVGDDIRYLDRHVHARLGQHVLRQFHVDQQLSVTVLVDGSASMAAGDDGKARRTIQIAAVLAYVALTGGDAVQLGIVHGDRVQMQRRRSGLRRAPEIFGELQAVTFHGDVRPSVVARRPVFRSGMPGLIVWVGDLHQDDLDEALAAWTSAGHEVIVVQVLGATEVDPEPLGEGAVRLVDPETGERAAVSIDASTIARYREAFDAWQAELRATVASFGGRHTLITSEAPLERTVLTDWRLQGLIT